MRARETCENHVDLMRIILELLFSFDFSFYNILMMPVNTPRPQAVATFVGSSAVVEHGCRERQRFKKASGRVQVPTGGGQRAVAELS